MRSLAASALDGPTDVLVNAGEYLNPQGGGHTGFSTAAPSLRSGYPASSLATLQDEQDEWGKSGLPGLPSHRPAPPAHRCQQVPLRLRLVHARRLSAGTR